MLVLAALFILALLLPGSASGEIRRLEAVGTAPIDGDHSRGNPRDVAILEAQREAVLRLAAELLIDSASGEIAEEDVEAALGTDAASYTTQFRIVEDRGERAALFSESGREGSEYVMVVEVQVESDLVRRRLLESGLLVDGSDPLTERSLMLEVRGLGAYGAYEALRTALLDGAGASAVQPIEWTRGRSLLRVESDQTAQNLVDRLLGNLPEGLEVSPHQVGDDRIHLRVEWAPPASALDQQNGSGPYPAAQGGRVAPPPVEARPPRGRR